jgi:hypothetical protein
VEAGHLPSTVDSSSLGLLDHLTSQLLQDRLARSTGHIMESRLLVDPLHPLGIGDMAVTAQDHQGVGPGVTQVLDPPLQHCEPLRAREAFGLEDSREPAPREALIEGQGHKTIAPLIAIVTGLFWFPMDGGLGVIDVEHDNRGWAGIGGDTLLQQHQRHARELGA